MEPWEVEQLRRAVAMLPPGQTAGALSKDETLRLIEEVPSAQTETRRYREAIAELRQVLVALDLDLQRPSL